jgi:hypothetical protein
MGEGGQDKIRRLNFYTTRLRTVLHGTFHYTVIVHTAHTKIFKYRYIARSTKVTVSTLSDQPVSLDGSVMY